MSDIGGEVGKPAPRDTQVADRWLRMQGVKKPEEAKPAGGFLSKVKEAVKGKATQPESPQQLITEAYDLFVERNDLKDQIFQAQRKLMEPEREDVEDRNKWADYSKRLSEARQKLDEKLQQRQALSLDKRAELLRAGKVGLVLQSITDEEQVDLQKVSANQTRVEGIEKRLDEIFSTSGTYEGFTHDLSRQVSLRQGAGEVIKLESFIRQVDVLACKLSRSAMLEGRSLTSVEEKLNEGNKKLAVVADERRAELLKNPDIFDFARDATLKEYKKQLDKKKHKKGFVLTPSREVDIDMLYDHWVKGERVLLTGATGTGKTEMVKFAAKELFGVDPEITTGHQDLSIYELLGKTGFMVKVGDVFRPAPLIRAMTGRDGRGVPFLFDEMNRAKNEALMGIKTIMNATSGDRVKVQTDSQGEFLVGDDYSFTAAINVKDAKHTTATKLDPAIERMFAGKTYDIDYIPKHELYDVLLAVLRDRRGGIPISQSDANFVLKNLCDATSWVQDAYQGRKVDTGGGSFLEARGEASVGKAASIQDAVLDPGVVIEWVNGWLVDKQEGLSFEEYLNKKIVIFINTKTYPEEDRYYLTEIFALKGFLKGQKASELMLSGLTQETLDRWSGNTAKKAVKKGSRDYLSAGRVAKLDPYRRFKRPVSAEAEELLREEVVEAEEPQVENLSGMMERAKEVLGKDFLGKDAIRTMEQKLKAIGVNVEFDIDKLPAFTYTEQDLQLAKQNGEMLVLRPDTMLRWGGEVPITLRELQELFKKDPLGKSGTPFYHSSSEDWYVDEKFYETAGVGEIKLQWALVKKEVLDGSLNQTWNDQATLLKKYQGGLKRRGATSADIKRRTATEVAWDTMLYYTNTGERLLVSVYDWGQTRASLGRLVCVGSFDSAGLCVRSSDPDFSNSIFGVCPSR
jgi:DNA polymerase III delta prime subunit